MKLRFIASSLLLMSLLSSCGQKELRSDIKDFVASFSLSEAMSNYKHAGYNNDKVTFKDGTKTEEKVTLEFNILDEENPSYNLTKKTKINDEEETIYQKYLTKDENKFFIYETSVDPYECSINDVKNLIRNFFYTKVMYEGTYHSDGMYYGDLVLETVRELQEFVTIDGNNSLYEFYHYTEGKVEGKDAKIEQYYSVNKQGMLVKNISKQSNGENYINQEINVFNYN